MKIDNTIQTLLPRATVTDWMDPEEVISTFMWGPLTASAYCELLSNEMNMKDNDQDGLFVKKVYAGRHKKFHGAVAVGRSRVKDLPDDVLGAA